MKFLGFILIFILIQLVTTDVFQYDEELIINVTPTLSRVIESPSYLQEATSTNRLLWTITCVEGYNCNLNCSVVEIIPEHGDKLLVFNTDSIQMEDAKSFVQPFIEVSPEPHMKLVFETGEKSQARFKCLISAQPIQIDLSAYCDATKGESGSAKIPLFTLDLTNKQIIQSVGFPSPAPSHTCYRWMIYSPQGYNIKLNCSVVELTQSLPCNEEMLIISRVGDINLSARPSRSTTFTQCDKRSFVTVSKWQKMTVGFLSAKNHNARGRFYCEASVQAEVTDTKQTFDFNYHVNVLPHKAETIMSPNFPIPIKRGSSMRWTVNCPQNHTCKLRCEKIDVIQNVPCNIEKFLVSKTGAPNMEDAEDYCNNKTIDIVSSGPKLSFGLVASPHFEFQASKELITDHGRFSCEVDPVPPCPCWNNGYGSSTPLNSIVSLVSNNAHVCMATIISRRHVLTEKLCIIDVGDFKIALATKNIANGETLLFKAKTQFIFSHCDSEIVDVALITIHDQFPEFVVPVCLPFTFASHNFTGANVTAMAFNFVSEHKKTSYNDLSLNIREYYPKDMVDGPFKYRRHDDITLAAAGGPIMYRDFNGTQFLVGILSSRFAWTGYHIKVTQDMIKWIEEQTQLNFCKKSQAKYTL